MDKLTKQTQESIDYIIFLEKRFDMIGDIIEILSTNGWDPKLKPKRNNPLHWAFYYGDLASGRYFYNKFPNALLLKNENGKYPLDIIIGKEYKNISLAQVKTLVT